MIVVCQKIPILKNRTILEAARQEILISENAEKLMAQKETAS